MRFSRNSLERDGTYRSPSKRRIGEDGNARRLQNLVLVSQITTSAQPAGMAVKSFDTRLDALPEFDTR
jgi:hypothetical protein